MSDPAHSSPGNARGSAFEGGHVPRPGHAFPTRVTGAALGWRAWVLCTSVFGVGWWLLLLRAPSVETWVDLNAPHASTALGDSLGVLCGAVALTVLAVILRARVWARRLGAVTWHAPLRAAEAEFRPLAAVPWVGYALLAGTSILDPARMASVFVGAWLLASSDWAWLERPLTRAARRMGATRMAWGILCLAYAAMVSHLVRLAHVRVDSLNARTFDLGIYDNILFNTLHGNFLGCSMIKGGVHTSAHFDPILALLAPLYAMAPGAKTAVVLQALWVLSGAFPAMMLARRSVGLGASLAVGLAWLCYPSVHGIVLHDVHSYALLGPCFLWLVLLAERGRWRWFGAMVIVTLATREDAAFCVMGVGVWMMVARHQGSRGIITVVVAGGYLAMVKLMVMPDAGLLMQNSDEVYAYANRFRRLIPEGGGALDAAISVATNPAFVIGHVVGAQKLASVTLLLVPLAALPLLGGRRLVLAIWGVAFVYLGSKPSLSYPLVHYATALYPALFAALPVGMAAVDRRLGLREGDRAATSRARHFTARWVLASAVLSGCAWGMLRENKAFALHTDSPWALSNAQVETAAWLEARRGAIPVEMAVTASNRVGPFFSARREMYLPSQRRETPWLVVHREDLGPAERRWIQELVASNRIERVDGRGAITVYRQVAGSARAAP